MKRFGSVTVLNGHIHQVVQKVEGNATFHTARSTAYPHHSGRRAGPWAKESTLRQTAHHDRIRNCDIQARRATARHRGCAAAGLSVDDENSVAVAYFRRYTFRRAEEPECFVGCFCGRLVSLCSARQLSGN